MEHKRIESLEQMTRKLVATGVDNPRDVERRMHGAAMLALISASHAVVNRYVVPTPLFRLEYDDDTHALQFAELHGRAPVPKTNAVDISMLDLITAGILRERVSLLYEGITGTGKTHTTEMIFRTIFPPDAYAVIRLSGAMTNVQQPYVEGVVENGVLKVRLRREALDRIAAIFIDEQNRGDTNQVLQLKDGKISLASGESGHLGLPVPRFNPQAEEQFWTLDYVEKRPIFVAAAQNPAGTKHAQYTGARGTDAAVKNRDLEVQVPNQMGTVGASLMLVDTGNGQHGEFVRRFGEDLGRYLGIDVPDTATLTNDITRWFALATDPRQTHQKEIRSVLELSDALSLMFSHDLEQEYAHDTRTAADWTEILKTYGKDFTYTSTLTASSKTMEQIRKVVQAFHEELVPRDMVKAKRLADALAITRKTHTALQSASPLETYLAEPAYITVRDMAGSFAITARDKQQNTTEDPIPVVDQVLKDYLDITEGFATSVGYRIDTGTRRSAPFDPNDPSYSVYGLALSKAFLDTESVRGRQPMTTAFIESLAGGVAVLRRLENSAESRKPLIGRMVADLATLAGFVHQYASELEPLFAQHPEVQARSDAFMNFYVQRTSLPGTPDIYLQRLPRVIGV